MMYMYMYMALQHDVHVHVYSHGTTACTWHYSMMYMYMCIQMALQHDVHVDITKQRCCIEWFVSGLYNYVHFR